MQLLSAIVQSLSMQGMQGLGFRDSGWGFWGCSFSVGAGFWGLEFRDSGLGLWGWRFGVGTSDLFAFTESLALPLLFGHLRNKPKQTRKEFALRVAGCGLQV